MRAQACRISHAVEIRNPSPNGAGNHDGQPKNAGFVKAMRPNGWRGRGASAGGKPNSQRAPQPSPAEAMVD